MMQKNRQDMHKIEDNLKMYLKLLLLIWTARSLRHHILSIEAAFWWDFGEAFNLATVAMGPVRRGCAVSLCISKLQQNWRLLRRQMHEVFVIHANGERHNYGSKNTISDRDLYFTTDTEAHIRLLENTIIDLGTQSLIEIFI